MTAAKAKGGGPRGRAPRLVGPSSGSAGSAGAESRGGKPERLKKRKQREAAEKEEEEDGGFALGARGEVRRLGIFVPVGGARTCLPDALFAAMFAIVPSLDAQLNDVRAALPPTANSDPSFAMAKAFLAQHGFQL